MRSRLRRAGIKGSPGRVLERLSIQRSVEAEAGGRTILGLVKATEEQLSLFKALDLPPPQHRDLINSTL